jgi:rod shape-determining protein MreC
LASPRVSQFRPLLALAVFLIVWWLAPVAVRMFSRAAFYNFQAPAWVAYSHLKDLQEFWGLRARDPVDLIAAGRDLARDNAALTLQLQQNAALPDELHQLEGLLHLPAQQDFRYEVARVIRRDQTAWWQQLLIRKGSRDGLAPGQGVVFDGGVVGRVKEVFPNSAIVELASSPSFRVAANLDNDPRPVIFQGGEAPPLGTPQGEVRDVAPDFAIPPGQSTRVVTSSLGGEFPQGLILGEVDHLALGTDGLFRAGPVRLDPRLSGLREVAVLVPTTPPDNPPAAPPPPH